MDDISKGIHITNHRYLEIYISTCLIKKHPRHLPDLSLKGRGTAGMTVRGITWSIVGFWNNRLKIITAQKNT